MLTHRNLLFSARVVSAQREPTDKVYCVLPISHIVGYSNILIGSLMVGAPKNDANPRWLRGVHCGLGLAYAAFVALAWSADGQTLGCLGTENGHLGVVVADPRDGYRRFVSLPDSLKAALGLAFSPDGRELILSALVKPHDWWALWRTEIANGPWRRVPMPFGESYPVRWNPDGWLYVVNDRALSTDYGSWRAELWRINLREGRAEYLSSLPEGCGFYFATISRDGRRGACTLQRTESDIYVAAPTATSSP